MTTPASLSHTPPSPPLSPSAPSVHQSLSRVCMWAWESSLFGLCNLEASGGIYHFMCVSSGVFHCIIYKCLWVICRSETEAVEDSLPAGFAALKIICTLKVVVKHFQMKLFAKWWISWRYSFQQWRFESQQGLLSWKYMQSCYYKVLWIKVFTKDKKKVIFCLCGVCSLQFESFCVWLLFACPIIPLSFYYCTYKMIKLQFPSYSKFGIESLSLLHYQQGHYLW